MSSILFAQISKVDEEKRLVYGRAVDETPDRAGEVFDYDTSKPHFMKWAKETAEASNGKSMGNLRAMHGKVAAGRLDGIEFDDSAKAIDIVAKVVDDQEWKKVMEGVYTGFSIGGNYVKKWDDAALKMDDKPMQRYTASPSEISLVDRPCIPSAKFFDVQKADGSVAQIEFAAEDEEEDPLVTLQRALGMSDEDFKKGDYPGHVFHGNQYGGGGEGHAGNRASGKAHEATKAADKANTKDSHSKAAAAHAKAAASQAKHGGSQRLIAYHQAMSSYHSASSSRAEKADVSVDLTKKNEPAIEYEVSGTDDEVAKLAKVMESNKLTVGKVIELVESELELQQNVVDMTREQAAIIKFEKAGRLRKGMYTIGAVARVLSDLDSIRQAVNREEQSESDTESKLPQKMVDAIGIVSELLKAMVLEETDELIGAAGDDFDAMSGDDFDTVPDEATAPTLLQMFHHMTPLRKVLKAAVADKEALKLPAAERVKAHAQTIHDTSIALGACCKEDASKLAKGTVDSFEKMMADAIAKAVNPLQDKITKLEAQPAQSRAVLKAVSKSGDVLPGMEDPVVEPVVKDGVANDAATEIKKLHKQGGHSLGWTPGGAGQIG